MSSRWIPISMRNYPTFTMATIEEHTLKGKWKMPHLNKVEAVDEEFEMFDAITVVYFSAVEGSGMRGCWRYV